MSEQNGDLPEMNEHLPGDNEPLEACPIDPEERLDTERVLGLFAPRTPRLKRERLLALVQSVRREVAPGTGPSVRFRTPWYWPAATAAMTATSLALVVVLVVRANAEPPVRVEFKERIVYRTISIPLPLPAQPVQGKEEAIVTVPQPEAGGVISPPRPNDYLKNRSVALSQGVDSLEFSQPIRQGSTLNIPATRSELMRQLGPTKGLNKSMQTSMTKSWIWPSW